MSENTVSQQNNPFGYESDEVKQSTFHFGGNFGKTFMTKFEWTDKGGKKDENGQPTDGEALDIVFNINGTEKGMRLFPVTKAFDENNTEVTDPTHPAFITAQKTFTQICVQIMKCYVKEDDVKAALSRKIDSFKQVCAIYMGLLPKNYREIPLDVFMQYQYNLKEDAKATYLEFPKKVSYGKFLCAAQKPTYGWLEIRTDKGLYYIDATEAMLKAEPNLANTATRHPYFVRNEWYVASNFANQQKETGANNGASESALNNSSNNSGTSTSASSTSW